jgi:hypothetical protein
MDGQDSGQPWTWRRHRGDLGEECPRGGCRWLLPSGHHFKVLPLFKLRFLR